MPILFNEDDHFDFEKPRNNLTAAIGERASWGYFDPGLSNYRDGYQSPPGPVGDQHRAEACRSSRHGSPRVSAAMARAVNHRTP